MFLYLKQYSRVNEKCHDKSEKRNKTFIFYSINGTFYLAFSTRAQYFHFMLALIIIRQLSEYISCSLVSAKKK